MGRLIYDLIAIAFGSQWPFSWAAWAFVTTILVAVASVITAVAPKLVTPISVEILVRPSRIVLWTFLAAPVSVLGTLMLTFTGVGIPIAVVAIFIAIAMVVLGTTALMTALTAQLVRGQGVVLLPWAAALIGMAVLRLVRLIPVVGAPLQSLIMLIGFSAAFAAALTAARSWHARRMPDAKQFEGERLIEWNAPDDDADSDRD
jgi:hypothetical protein